LLRPSDCPGLGRVCNTWSPVSARKTARLLGNLFICLSDDVWAFGGLSRSSGPQSEGAGRESFSSDLFPASPLSPRLHIALVPLSSSSYCLKWTRPLLLALPRPTRLSRPVSFFFEMFFFLVPVFQFPEPLRKVMCMGSWSLSVSCLLTFDNVSSMFPAPAAPLGFLSAFCCRRRC